MIIKNESEYRGTGLNKLATTMIRLTFVLALCFIAPINAFSHPADDLILMSEDFPPFNFQEDGQLKGISIDLMTEMLLRMQSKQSHENIEILPWARSYRALQEVKNTVLFVVTRTESREHLFKWVGPVSSAKNVLLARKDKGIVINSIDDIRRYKIGGVIDDAALQLIIEAGIPKESIDIVPSPLQNIYKLQLGRIELFAYDESVTKWQMKKAGINPDDYETVYLLAEGEHYIAFHRDTSDSLIAKFQKVLDQLKAQGVYDKILSKYLE